MNHKTTFALGLAALSLMSAGAQATDVVQTHHFSIVQSAGPGSGNLAALAATDLATTFTSFNASLGTLTNANVSWTVTLGGEYDIPNTGFSGSAGGGGSGALYLGAPSYDGGGIFGLSSSGGSGDHKTFSAQLVKSKDFASPWPGTYNPAILTTILGVNPFEVKFTGAFNINYVNVSTLTTTTTADVTLTYTYTPSAAVPEPGSLAMMGLGLAAVLGAGRLRRSARA